MIWTAVLVCGVGCYLLKLAGLSVPPKVLEHPVVERVADLMPVALLAALIAVQVFSAPGDDGPHLVVDARLAGLGACIAAGCGRRGVRVIVEHVAPRSGRCVRPRTCLTQAARVNRADGAKPSGTATRSADASQSSNPSPTAVAGPAWLPRCHRGNRPRRGRVTIWTQRAGPPLEEEPASTSSARPERHAA